MNTYRSTYRPLPSWPRYAGLIAASVTAYLTYATVWAWSDYLSWDNRISVTCIAMFATFVVVGRLVMAILEFVYEAYRDAIDTRTRPSFLAVAISTIALAISALPYLTPLGV